MKNIDSFIRSLDTPIRRKLECEKNWCYEAYSDEVEEALNYHCTNAVVSEHLKHQLSQLVHQGYVLFGDEPFAISVRSIYETMERIINGANGRGRLKHISKAVGLVIFHTHVGQSSCVIENWVNHANNTHLANQPFTHEVVYENLISSLSKPKRTGEWLVYDKTDRGIKFWCIWLHSAGDDKLIEVINGKNT